MSKDLRFAMLLDCYGEFLTPHQYRLTELYYCADLSLSEIAEIVGITRQGVRDVIVRAEAYLTEIEDKTGLIRRFHTMQSQLGEIADCIRQVPDLNDKRLGSDELEVLASRIQSLTDKLIQE